MKRKLSLMVMILLIILSSSSPKSFATKQDVIKDLPGDSLYVLSTNVDRDALSYAEYEKYNIYSSVDDITDDNTNELQARNNLSYGTAFRLNDIDYIPIISNDKIIFLLAILETDGEYSWTLSEDFSQKLNELSELTSVENPAGLYTKEGNVYAEISGNNYQLTFNPEIAETNNENSLKSSEKAKATNILNINTKSIIELNDVSNKVNASQSSKYLKLDLKETQGDQSWCSAFAGAQILRYRKKGNVKAKTIMKYFYPKVGDSALKKKSISNKQLIKYANIKKSYPTRKSGTLSLSSVKKQINSGKPIYLGCKGSGTYKKARHALVLRGYNTSNKAYSVWNPWNAKYVSMSTSSKSIAVSGGEFIWDATIYGW